MSVVAVVVIALAALAVLAVIAWPLVTRAVEDGTSEDVELARVREELERTLAAIAEIAQDHRAGHLSDADFADLDRGERARAVELMRRRDELESQQAGSALR